MLGPSEGGLGGQDAPDGVPASERNANPCGENAFFADVTTSSTFTFDKHSSKKMVFNTKTTTYTWIQFLNEMAKITTASGFKHKSIMCQQPTMF